MHFRVLRYAYELLDRPLEREQLLQLILDSSFFFSSSDATVCQTSYRDLDMQTRRLCYSLHTERYSRLSLIPKRNRKKCNRVDVPRHTPAWDINSLGIFQSKHRVTGIWSIDYLRRPLRKKVSLDWENL